MPVKIIFSIIFIALSCKNTVYKVSVIVIFELIVCKPFRCLQINRGFPFQAVQAMLEQMLKPLQAFVFEFGICLESFISNLVLLRLK